MQGLPDHPPSLVVRLFGGFEVWKDRHTICGLQVRKGERLPAYLALHATHCCGLYARYFVRHVK